MKKFSISLSRSVKPAQNVLPSPLPRGWRLFSLNKITKKNVEETKTKQINEKIRQKYFRKKKNGCYVSRFSKKPSLFRIFVHLSTTFQQHENGTLKK